MSFRRGGDVETLLYIWAAKSENDVRPAKIKFSLHIY